MTSAALPLSPGCLRVARRARARAPPAQRRTFVSPPASTYLHGRTRAQGSQLARTHACTAASSSRTAPSPPSSCIYYDDGRNAVVGHASGAGPLLPAAVLVLLDLRRVLHFRPSSVLFCAAASAVPSSCRALSRVTEGSRAASVRESQS